MRLLTLLLLLTAGVRPADGQTPSRPNDPSSRPPPPAAPPPPSPPIPIPAPPGTVDRTTSSLLRSQWQLTDAPTSTGLDAAALTPYTLTFHWGAPLFSGTAACSSFTGLFSAEDGGAVTLGPTATGIERCDPTPADAAVLRLLASVTRFGSTGGTLTLDSDAGTLLFTRAERPTAVARVAWRGSANFVCGAAGPVRIRRDEGDIQLWLSDALADRQVGARRLGIHHVLPAVPDQDAAGRARYADGPLGVETSGMSYVVLSLGDDPFACTVADPVPNEEDGSSFNVSDIYTHVRVHPKGRGRAHITINDAGAVTEMRVDVTTPETGQTVYRGPFGFVLTTITGGCDGPKPTRAIVEQPERTYETCIPALP